MRVIIVDKNNTQLLALDDVRGDAAALAQRALDFYAGSTSKRRLGALRVEVIDGERTERFAVRTRLVVQPA